MKNKSSHRTIKGLASRFASDESGATTIEYGMIAALLGMMIIFALGPIGETLRDDVFGTVATTLNSATATSP